MKRWISVCLSVAFAFSLVEASGKKDAVRAQIVKPNRDISWLELGPGYDEDVDPGAAEAALDRCLYLDTFDWEGDEYEYCCNFWEVYLSVNFTELDAPLTSLWEGDYDEDTDARIVYNGMLHEPHDEDYSVDSYADTTGPNGYDLMGITAMGDETSGISVVVTQYQAGYEEYDSWEHRGYEYVVVTVHNSGTTDYTGGSATIFNDNDAGGGWWPDEECADDWGDCNGDEDAYLWNKTGKHDDTGLIYQYFDPAVVDLDEDGNADFPDDPPYIYAGMSYVDGADSVNLGAYEDPWGTFEIGVFADLLEGYYDYDGTYEADSNATDLGTFITVYFGDLAADEEKTVVYAFVGGESEDDIVANSEDATDMWTEGLKVEENLSLPAVFNLKQNYPNPFNPNTAIAFELDRDGRGHLDIFDISGKLVKTLAHGAMPAGRHTVQWDATAVNGEAVPSGVYFYKLTHNGRSQSQKMVLMR